MKRYLFWHWRNAMSSVNSSFFFCMFKGWEGANGRFWSKSYIETENTEQDVSGGVKPENSQMSLHEIYNQIHNIPRFNAIVELEFFQNQIERCVWIIVFDSRTERVRFYMEYSEWKTLKRFHSQWMMNLWIEHHGPLRKYIVFSNFIIIVMENHHFSVHQTVEAYSVWVRALPFVNV